MIWSLYTLPRNWGFWLMTIFPRLRYIFELVWSSTHFLICYHCAVLFCIIFVAVTLPTLFADAQWSQIKSRSDDFVNKSWYHSNLKNFTLRVVVSFSWCGFQPMHLHSVMVTNHQPNITSHRCSSLLLDISLVFHTQWVYLRAVSLPHHHISDERRE